MSGKCCADLGTISFTINNRTATVSNAVAPIEQLRCNALNNNDFKTIFYRSVRSRKFVDGVNSPMIPMATMRYVGIYSVMM